MTPRPTPHVSPWGLSTARPGRVSSWAGQEGVNGGPAWGPSLAPAVPWVSFMWFAFSGPEPDFTEHRDVWEEEKGGQFWPSGHEPERGPPGAWRGAPLYLPRRLSSFCVQSCCVVFMEFLQLRGQDLNLFVAPLLPPSEGRLSSAAQDDAQASGQEGADLVPFPLGPVWMMDVARNAELARELLGARASRGRIAGGDLAHSHGSGGAVGAGVQLRTRHLSTPPCVPSLLQPWPPCVLPTLEKK